MKTLVSKNKNYKKKEKFYKNFGVSDNSSLPVKLQIKDIRHVYFEISNLCVYSNIHCKCPVSLQKTKKILSSKIVKKVIKELGNNNYQGFIAFHRYNEPLGDPRLFEFISYVKKYCSKAMVRILTNGFYLTQEIIDQFKISGIEVLEVSGYGMKEYTRLSKLKADFPYRVFYAIFDNRKSLYEKKKINLSKPCFAQLNDITINCEGKLGLCCLDWKNNHIFGDLKKISLKKILNNPSFLQVYKNLTQGKRNLDLCSRCDWQR